MKNALFLGVIIWVVIWVGYEYARLNKTLKAYSLAKEFVLAAKNNLDDKFEDIGVIISRYYNDISEETTLNTLLPKDGIDDGMIDDIMDYIIKYRHAGLDDIKSETEKIVDKIHRSEETFKEFYNKRCSFLICVIACVVMLMMLFI